MLWGIGKSKESTAMERERALGQRKKEQELERIKQQVKFDAFRKTPEGSALTGWDGMTNYEREMAIDASDWRKQLDDKARQAGFESHDYMTAIGNMGVNGLNGNN
jgi:hypothetical protein